MELIKKTVKFGNSAGILLPKKYLNSQVRVTLEPLNIEKDIINILMKENLLKEVMGVYLTGSYARSEQTIKSDIDILIITSNISKRIVKEGYDLLLISQKDLEKTLEKNILPLLPMIKEAKPILNENLLNRYKNTKLTKKNLKWHFEIIKSGLKLNKAALSLEDEAKSKYSSNAIAYSLILHLRSLYIVGHLMKNKLWNNKEFIDLIKKIAGSKLAYEKYAKVKANKKSNKNLPTDMAEKLYNYIYKELKNQEKSI